MTRGCDDGVPPDVAAHTLHDAILFQLVLRGALGVAALSAATAESAEAVQAALAASMGEGLLAPERRAGRELVALTSAGRACAASVIAAERAALRPAVASLDAEFAGLNRRVKQILHRWQVRVDRTTEVLNDHRDAAYDAAVLAELRATHRAAEPVLERLEVLRPRYASLRARLGAALVRAAAGERGAIAGVTVDSFHAAWWELHADLLAILGRARDADEV